MFVKKYYLFVFHRKLKFNRVNRHTIKIRKLTERVKGLRVKKEMRASDVITSHR